MSELVAGARCLRRRNRDFVVKRSPAVFLLSMDIYEDKLDFSFDPLEGGGFLGGAAGHEEVVSNGSSSLADANPI